MPPIILPHLGVRKPSAGQDPYFADMDATLQLIDDASDWWVPAGSTLAQAQAVVDAAEATYAGASGGGGTVRLAPGLYNWTTGTLLVTKPAISIRGAGSAATIINYTGTGACIKWQTSPSTTQQQGKVTDLTILGSSSAAAVGIHCYDTGTVPAFYDLVISNFTGASGRGMLLENLAIWNERVTGVNVHLDNNTVGLRLVSSSPTFNSFAYHRWLDLQINVNAGQIGIQTAGTAHVYSSSSTVMFNGAGSAIGFDLADTSDAGGNWVLQGEGLTTGIRVAAGATFSPNSGMIALGAPNIGVVKTAGVMDGFGRLLNQIQLPPAVVMGAAAGTAPPGALINGNAMRGAISFGTGSAPTTGTLLTVTHADPYPNNVSGSVAEVVIAPIGRLSARLLLAIASRTNAGFVVECDVAPSAGQGNGIYGFAYHVIG